MFKYDFKQLVERQLANNGIVLDAGETAVYTRELEYIQAGAVEADFPALKGLQLVPIAGGGIFPGARTHRWFEVEKAGEAQLLDTMAPEDFPSAEVRGAENVGLFRSIGAKYIVTVEDIRAKPSMTNDVEAMKGSAVRESIEQLLDRIVFGKATALTGPFKGLLHNDNSQDDTSAVGGNATLTGTEVQNAERLISLFRTVRDRAFKDTLGVHEDFDFVVSTSVWTMLGLFLPATTVGGGMTVGDFLLKYVPGVRSISYSSRQDAAGGSGKDRILAFPRDPKVLDFLLPTRFEQWAPQLSGMAWSTFCAAKTGGLRIKKPKAVRRVDVTIA